MARNRSEHREPVIRAFTALCGETHIGAERLSWWRALCLTARGRDGKNMHQISDRILRWKKFHKELEFIETHPMPVTPESMFYIAKIVSSIRELCEEYGIYFDDAYMDMQIALGSEQNAYKFVLKLREYIEDIFENAFVAIEENIRKSLEAGH